MPKRESYFSKQSAWIWLWLSAIIIVIDQLSKQLVVMHLSPGQSVEWLPFFNITLAFNTGAAYSFLGGESGWQVPVISAIVIVVVAILCVWLGRIRRNQYLLAIALSLIVGGALGNLIDRLRLAYVIDFFDFHIKSWHFATFNFGDAAISVGVVLLLIRLFLDGKNGKAL